MLTKNYDIITFGAASQDILVKLKDDKILNNQSENSKNICFNLGSKIEVEDVFFSSGGGGTNSAATFVKQGFITAFCGAIGSDLAGLEIVRELKALEIDTKFLVKKKGQKSNHSIIFITEKGERTIFMYRGASDLLSKDDIPWKKIKKTKWFYLAPFSGLLCDSFDEIVNFGFENGIKIAVNPSKKQLALPKEKIKEIFGKIEILFLNKEEALFLIGKTFENLSEFEICKKLYEFSPKIVALTKGKEGVIVYNGKNFYSAPSLPVRVVDTTGAGDSFASGFLSDFIKTQGNIETAIQLGIANAVSNITQLGAKTGLLDKDSYFERVKVEKI